MKTDLSGKVALVTGAARGIGKAIADTLADNGARVHYTDIDETTVLESAARSPGGRGQGAKLDVTDAAAISLTIDRILRESGRLDILVNNAGINTIRNRVTTDQYPPEEWEKILRVDLTGPFLLCRRAAAAMLAQGSGRIINISSVFGLVPARLQCAYTAAKAGLINFTKSMALEFGPKGVLVNAIAPGSILTDATRQLFYAADGSFHHAVRQMLDHVPLGRPGTPEEIAVAALFLAAPENSYTNGHVLTVDGGWTAGYTRDF